MTTRRFIMKIKYTNKIKNQISNLLLQEIVQLSFSIVPYQSIHIFSFEYIKSDKICITHSVPLSNIEKKIYLTRCEIPSENIILLRNNDTIYLFAESEYALI